MEEIITRPAGSGSDDAPVPLGPGPWSPPCPLPGPHPSTYLPPGRLARFWADIEEQAAIMVDADTTEQLTRAYMAAVLGELVVVTRWRIVPDGAR